ncbi:MAG: hypothetical protein ACOYO7_10490 [Phycisphaerales bacterium]
MHNKLLRNATVGAMLFGGTLGAANAGLTVNSANIYLDVGGAQFLTSSVSTAMAGGMAYDATSGGSLTLSPFTSTGFNLGANSAGGAATWSVFAFEYTFTANSNMNAVLSGDTAAEGAVIVMLDTTNSQTQTMFLRFDGDATAWNSGALALVSGHNYSLVINPGGANGSTDTGTVLNFAVTAVPAPGAAALVGVAGLVAGRRRRA